MLVVISDLHLTDGTGGSTISPGAFIVFAERLRDLAFSASWRADGRYRPVEQIDLLLLGDVLDMIRSARWSEANVRPWNDPASAAFADVVRRVTTGVLEQNKASLQVLRGLANDGAVRIPPATAVGQPAHDAESPPLAVRIHYMVGNHDWFLHLPGEPFDQIRETVVRHMGLANSPTEPFPHDPSESDSLQDVLRRHGVFARHGDVFDPFNFEGDRNTSSLGDAIVVELLTRFGVQVGEELAHELPANTLAGLRELDNIRPLLLVPVWIDGLLERTSPYPAQRKRVKAIWDRLADEFLDLPVVRQRDSWNPRDLIDGLQRALKFSRRVSIGWASSIINWLADVSALAGESLYKRALAERDFRNRRARHIVYGHTHQGECVPLDASYSDTGVMDQVYFNSGTWRRVYRPTRLAPHEHEFIATDEMRYLAFFADDERSGRPYETWSGTLGVDASPQTIYRVDAGGEGHAPHQPVSTPDVHVRGPHFQLPTHATRGVPGSGH